MEACQVKMPSIMISPCFFPVLGHATGRVLSYPCESATDKEAYT